jgi:amino acid adenylation domain-containing protein
MNYDIGKKIEAVMKDHMECDAINVEGKTYKYNELLFKSKNIKNALNNKLNKNNQFVGIFCYRTFEAYSGIIGTLFSKNAYLPINLNLPIDKINKILKISECPAIILGEEGVDTFSNLNRKGLRVICPNPGKKIENLIKNDKYNEYILPEKILIDENKQININKDDPAYLMFTSGSTGEPKGIAVSHENLYTYSSYIIEKYQFTSNDRISQAPDISFDLSIQDLFTSFLCGGCLYVLPKEVMVAPFKFINKNKLTVWTSVPSVGIFMDNLGQLLPESLPFLRLSLFCGEGLPCELASKWKRAAVNSKVINFYGPTEATVMFTSHEWELNDQDKNSFNGLASIGKTFEHMKLKLIEDMSEVDDGKVGEICISGPQVINGYFKDEKLTKDKFITLNNNKNEIWYRTGDLAMKGNDDNYFFVGRIDDQMQVRGHRVEMLEIDNVIRKVVGHPMAVSVPVMEAGNNIVEDIVAFSEYTKNNLSEEDVIKKCRSFLPDYMIPSKISFIEKLPLNQNGKIDKKKLYNELNNKNVETDQSLNKLQSVNNLECCSICLKTLNEDKELLGLGLIKVIKHDGNETLICHTCLKGF